MLLYCIELLDDLVIDGNIDILLHSKQHNIELLLN